jgi:DNA processing protein
VPVSIFSPSSRGSNRLIQEAEPKLVLTASDILDELGTGCGIQPHMTSGNDSLEGVGLSILELLGKEPLNLDEICRRVGLSASTVAGVLTILEIRGVARQIDNSGNVLARTRKDGSSRNECD